MVTKNIITQKTQIALYLSYHFPKALNHESKKNTSKKMENIVLINKLPKYIYLYFICQSINLTVAVISIAVAATVGELIAPNSLYSTVPYGLQFFFLLLCTYPAALLMKKNGRKSGFFTGAFFLILAGVLGYLSVINKSFILLILAHGLIGASTAFANYYRFAVTDNLPENLKSKALSLVVSGGVIAGIIGPTIAITLQDIAGFEKFSLCYGVLILLAIINMIFIFLFPQKENQQKKEEMISHNQPNTKTTLSSYFYLAVLSAALGYGLMNLLMVQSSLQMNHLNIPFEHSSIAIQWHVVAMFLPSFFTGILIHKLGHSSILIAGFLLFMASFVINLLEVGYTGMLISLIVLGLAWNFSYVGGSSLLTHSLKNSTNQQKWQGVCDTTIAVLSTIGAMLPSILLNTIGWGNTNIISAVVAMVPILFLVSIKVFTKTQ
jgi:predicted MFS family arabinose efflux permease